ncbi:hypothetical protein ASPVEDRAFT_150216 [Aspergillus versicolor CBS 583.65]|uniref:Myb-like domain-containing protein n=1 Tax=Aspergillus versicolor CBS 583.65 TaxID=1036611 RepID=A0A1L9PIM7_ASPVE|nr:uncharacterized protein ASPVEDRAFT_150216 [Aspergillus versicolor CBS 583.65]OJJ01390.1 hypothetical protein ASPVEDRAFT_150216 [Aspergillus versicolor CBS 583.65]
MVKKTTGKRPKKRNIVRWDENLDELLLLTIQSVCNAKSVKIPWAEVAATMGHHTTEGAITQHLAKLRIRRIQANKQVPPPLRRGSVIGNSKLLGVSNTKPPKANGQVDNDDSSDEEWVENRSLSRRRASTKRKKPRMNYAELQDAGYEEESDDSGEELVAPGADFLELPNDKQQEAARTPIHTSKLVSYKCPKSFLAGLDKMPKEESFQAALPRTPTLKPEPALKREAAVKPEPATPSRGVYETFPNEAFVSQANLPTGFSSPISNAGPAHSGFAAHADFPLHVPAAQTSVDANTMYIPTGNLALDLPPIGDIYSDPFVSEPFTMASSFPSLQGYQQEQPLFPNHGFQEMLGEYLMQPEESEWYCGQQE